VKPRLLDLFCGAGGAATGYARAGFDVVGVDIAPQPRYPFTFHQGDAMTWPLDGFAAIHASPPCKHFTKTGWSYHFGYHDNHPDLLTPTRERLMMSGVPYWVIENVPGAPMRPDFILCGSQFGLNLRRHRWFEISPPMFDLVPPCGHRVGVASPHGRPHFKGEAKLWAAGMAINWMTPEELAQAIPPAYTEYIGRHLLDVLERAA
jgi:DNA (cytosine-5)-methyltransferase 1